MNQCRSNTKRRRESETCNSTQQTATIFLQIVWRRRWWWARTRSWSHIVSFRAHHGTASRRLERNGTKKKWWYQGEDVEKSRMPVEHSRALFETQFEQSIEKQEVEFSRIKVEHVGSMSHSHVVVIPNSAVKSRASPFWTTIPWSADKAMKRSCGWLAWTSSQQVDLWYW